INILFSILCIFLIISCAERKIYLPDGKDRRDFPQEIDKEEKKVSEDSTLDLEKEKLPYSEPLQIIKKLNEEVEDIYFDFDSYDIRPDAIPTLKKIATALQKYPKIKVIIEGHCDERGTNEYNFALGQKRAYSAKQYLMSLGVVSGRIEIISYGEEKPLCTEQNENCWQRNRRAHFVFIEEGK
ncbi:MAG: peptidoglycan-associated lipoprotein Pal, partial [Candidatus Ratteibacteria bacterium]